MRAWHRPPRRSADRLSLRSGQERRIPLGVVSNEHDRYRRMRARLTFPRLSTRQPIAAWILLRLRDQQPDNVVSVLQRLAEYHNLDELAGCRVVVTEGLIRIRGQSDNFRSRCWWRSRGQCC